ncbi:MAG: YbaB/EbfC family nucleoid-associated protein [Actinomycetota bacterium]|nr:YbaB/EbfC family nucleoid-associated protein [Actinomycetota bacterium]
MGALFAQASKMQEQLVAAQQEAAESLVEGVAGGGVVRISVSGTMEFQSVTIDPSAVDPDDVEMLQDLVLAALHDAVTQVGELQQGSMGLGGLDLGGLDLGDLLGG